MIYKPALSKEQMPAKQQQKKHSGVPSDIEPMLATLVDAPPGEDGWVYEVKWDGYRCLGYRHNGSVELRSRNNKSFNDKFYPVFNALTKWNINAIVDGEIIVVNDKGVPDFSDLQAWRSEADGHLALYLFDLLWLDGRDLMNETLAERRKLLHEIVDAYKGNDGTIKVSENFDATGAEFFAIADKMGLEGIMAKRTNSQYSPGLRTKDWQKIKTEKRQEAIVGRYTMNDGPNKRVAVGHV